MYVYNFTSTVITNTTVQSAVITKSVPARNLYVNMLLRHIFNIVPNTSWAYFRLKLHCMNIV